MSAEMKLAMHVDRHNVSVMPLRTRKLVHESRKFSGERWGRMEKAFKRASEVSHTRSINRPSRPRYAKAAPGFGNAFPKLVRQ